MVKTRHTIVAKMMVLVIAGAVSAETKDSDWLVTNIDEPVRIEKRLDGRQYQRVMRSNK